MAVPIPLPRSAYSSMLGQPGAQVMPQAAPVTTQTTLPAQQVPQTGLIGSEQALLGGQAGSEQALTQGLGQSSNTLLGAAGSAIGVMGQGANQAMGYLGAQSNPVYQAATNTFSADTNVGANITDPLNQGAANFQGYLGGGQGASKMQADLSGASGPAAQQAAYAAYQSSPAMQYQMDQMQKATERSAAARGGALGGNVLMELQRNAAGIASQDYQNQFNNLGQVASQGLAAAGQVAGLKSQQAGIAGNLQASGMQANAQAAMANQAAQNTQMLANQQQKMDVASRLSDLASMYGINTGNIILGAGQAVAGNQLGASQLIGQSRYSTGTNLAAGRTQAGQAIAQNASSAATNIGNLLSQQGLNISNEMSADISNATKMIYDYGMQDKISNENLAAMIANITSGQATNAQNAYANIGATKAAGTMGAANALQGGLKMGLQTGLLGGGGTSSGGGGAGATTSGYTGDAYKNWVAKQ